jgi:hypothetical protein
MAVHDPADNSLLPYDSDAFDPKAPQKPRPAVLGDSFAYIGQGLSLEQFQAYVAGYDFGKVVPDYVVFHHTANPDATYAPIGSDPRTKWDRGEQGLGADAVLVKRARQLDGLKNYYASLGWNCGPHLFIDDRYIWLFSPMNQVGIHAKWGNSFRAHGSLHYSVGIEVIGYYERVTWPAPVARLVGGAVRALQTRLAISSDYMYSVNKPGMKIVKGEQICANPSRLRFGGLSSHHDYNKPECPGSAITEAFYTSVVKGANLPPVSLPPAQPITKRYRVRGLPVYERSDHKGPQGGCLKQDQVIEIDDHTNGHIATLNGQPAAIGFIRFDPDTLEAL